MIQMQIEVVNAEKAIESLERFKGNLVDKIKGFLKTEGAAMELEIKQELNIGGRQGRIGPRGGKIYIPSEPGEPPHKDTGNLQASIGHRVTVERLPGQSSAGAEFTLDIGSLNGGGAEVQYAGDLEVGTSKMAPRPWLTPIVIQHADKFPDGISAEVKTL